MYQSEFVKLGCGCLARARIHAVSWSWPWGMWMENGKISQTVKEKKQQLTLPENLFHNRKTGELHPQYLEKLWRRWTLRRPEVVDDCILEIQGFFLEKRGNNGFLTAGCGRRMFPKGKSGVGKLTINRNKERKKN